MSEADSDKSHDASEHKLREAKKKGQVAKSNEVAFAAVLVLFVIVLMAIGPRLAQFELSHAVAIWRQAIPLDRSEQQWADWLIQIISSSLLNLAPLLLGVVVICIIANLAQTGFIFSATPITPDFTKLNPATGLQRLFSKKVLYEAVRSCLKLALVGIVAYLCLQALLPALLHLGLLPANLHGAKVYHMSVSLLLKMVFVIAILAALDAWYTHWDFAKRMRMSHKEVTDEHKQLDGDPRIKQRIRQLRNELLAQTQSSQRLPQADVLITNPTHIAVALVYKHGEMPAPKLLLKARGELALKLREAARRQHIPIVENPPLARAIYKRMKADEWVPEELYPQVAKILLWIYAMRQRRAATPVAMQGGR